MLIPNENVFKSKTDFEFETRTTSRHVLTGDRPHPREIKTQDAQFRSGHKPEGRNDLHVTMKHKQR